MATHRVKLCINSGVCVCGHSWTDHHLSMICSKNAWDAIGAYIQDKFPDRRWKDGDKEMTYPMYVPGECEFHGSNECGGQKYNDATGQWEDHCHHYKDKEGPLGEVEYND